MILTEADRDVFFPTVQAYGDELVGMIKRAQLIAESTMGAGRRLEASQYVEIVGIARQSQSLQLSYYPVLSSPTPVFESRTHKSVDGFQRTIPITDWVIVPTGEYKLDYETGRLYLYVNATQYSNATQIRANYSSGFDFETETAETEEIKTALGALMMWLESLPGKGVTSLKSLGVTFTSTYRMDAGISAIPAHLLFPFQKYQPRGI